MTADRVRAWALAGAAVAALTGAGVAAAQTPPTEAGSPAAAAVQAPNGEASAVSEVVVVGSQIQGAKIGAALPVTVVDQRAIDATGAVSGDELFRSIPQLGDVTFNSSYMPFSSNGARGDVNSVNLRSLGVGNTLVLLNGRRVVNHPTSQANDQLVPVLGYNTNAIPVEGLKRLEVLRDGAAAIYGADAVAGVVNTVLQDRFDGLTVDARYGAAEGTHLTETSFNVFAGHNLQGGRGNVSLFASYLDRTQLLSGDEPYTASSDKRPLFAERPGVRRRRRARQQERHQCVGCAGHARGQRHDPPGDDRADIERRAVPHPAQRDRRLHGHALARPLHRHRRGADQRRGA